MEASTYMSREISRISFPMSNVASFSFGKGKQRNTNRNVSSFNNCNKQRGKRLIVEKINGVDVSDLTRFHSKKEWSKVDADVKKGILENPAWKKLREERKQHDVSAVGIGGNHKVPLDGANIVFIAIAKESKGRIVATVVHGVMDS